MIYLALAIHRNMQGGRREQKRPGMKRKQLPRRRVVSHQTREGAQWCGLCLHSLITWPLPHTSSTRGSRLTFTPQHPAGNEPLVLQHAFMQRTLTRVSWFERSSMYPSHHDRPWTTSALRAPGGTKNTFLFWLSANLFLSIATPKGKTEQPREASIPALLGR